MAAYSEGRPLAAYPEGRPLAAHSEGRPLAAYSEGWPLATYSEGRPLAAYPEGRPQIFRAIGKHVPCYDTGQGAPATVFSIGPESKGTKTVSEIVNIHKNDGFQPYNSLINRIRRRAGAGQVIHNRNRARKFYAI